MEPAAEIQNMQLASSLIKILTVTNLWPKNKKRDFAFFLKLIIMDIMLTFIADGMLYFIYYYLNNIGFNFDDLADAIATTVAVVIAQSYLLCLSLVQPQLEELFDELGDFTVYGKPTGIEITDRNVNIFVEICAIYMSLAVTATVAYALTENCVDNVVNDCGLMLFYHMPYYNIFRYPQRYVVLFLQGVNGLSICMMAFYADCAMIVTAEYLVNRLAHLKILLREIPDMDIEKRKVHVKKCILYHYKILDISRRSTAANYNFFMVHVSMSSLIISLILYPLMLEFKFILFAHVVCWIIIIVLCCLMGERLLGASIDLADVVYESIPWDGDLETQKSLLMMLIQSQKPLYVPGGLDKYLSHSLLVKILKGTYSFLTLMAH